MKRVAVAASGGRDSTAMLHCTARCGAGLGIEVVALHVHHGLLDQADEWLRQVRSQAGRWGAGFASCRLQTSPAPGQSVEAWARRERYAALAQMATDSGCTLVLLAHHRRDQAETWLLQALRSGGPAGLSAMPAQAERDGLRWARPWLDMPRRAIDSYLRRHRLRHIEDSSNADPRFARSRLRMQVWPALEGAFPDVEKALTGAARQARHATLLADEVAALDLPSLARGDGLDVAAWLALPAARRRNALQAWLRQCQPGCPDSLLDRLCAELHPGSDARWPTPQGELRLYRGVLRPAALAAARVSAASLHDLASASASSLDLRQSGSVPLPDWNGSLQVWPVGQGGAAPALLQHVLVRARQGGERFSLAPGAPERSLKKQFQTRGIPAWTREGPLLYTADDRLLFVPGLGIDARLWAAQGQPQLGLRWCPHAGVAAAAGQPGR